MPLTQILFKGLYVVSLRGEGSLLAVTVEPNLRGTENKQSSRRSMEAEKITKGSFRNGWESPRPAASRGSFRKARPSLEWKNYWAGKLYSHMLVD